LQFEFDEKVYIYGTITDSEDIKFIRNGEENKDKTSVTLTGFEIIIKASNQEKIAKAKEQTAPRLTNILSCLAGAPINHKTPKLRTIRNGQTYHTVQKTFRSGYLKSIGIDKIHISKLSSLLENHPKLNMQLAHANNGERAFSNNDFPQAIREFYLIFEDTCRVEEMKYKNLRHAVSHIKLSSEDAIRDLRGNFRIPIKLNDDIDLNNPEIRKIIGVEAKKLREAVGYYLNGQLKNEIS
jgi:hypothetical protein